MQEVILVSSGRENETQTESITQALNKNGYTVINRVTDVTASSSQVLAIISRAPYEIFIEVPIQPIKNQPWYRQGMKY